MQIIVEEDIFLGKWRLLINREEVYLSIRWTIADIIEIVISMCTHKIKIKIDHMRRVEHQRWINPPMQEVVKKKIIKWLDVGFVYLISDSTWVSSVPCVPNKGCIIMDPNKKNNFVPICLVLI